MRTRARASHLAGGTPLTDEDFKAFYEADIDRLRAFAYRLTGDWADADDLAQDAMVRTMRAWRRIKERPQVYVRAVMVNLHRSLLRRAGTEARHLLSMARSEEVAPASDDDSAVLWSEIQRLPLRQREAIVLHYYEDLPQNEVAHILGCPPGTVNSLVYRGLARLRERLSLDEVAAGSGA
jgi:RNA polymerase sigma-70 factor (sigma-E family)